MFDYIDFLQFLVKFISPLLNNTRKLVRMVKFIHLFVIQGLPFVNRKRLLNCPTKQRLGSFSAFMQFISISGGKNSAQ